MHNPLILDLALRLDMPITQSLGANLEPGLIPPKGDPPANALIDVNGKFIVDRNGKYLVTLEQ